MNANELADELENDYWDSRTNKIMLESAKMLRQQQAEIEALKEALIVEEESYILLDEECLFAKEAIKLHQAEIEALKKEAALQRLSDFTQEAENEPVAWTSDDLNLNWLEDDFGTQITLTKNKWREGLTPLYTHPAKTLTDEEIKDEWFDINKSALSRIEVDMQLIFARAILRKAQEK